MDAENFTIVDSCIKVGDFRIFKRIDNEKLLTNKIVQFSYLDGNKRDRQYSSNFVDISKDSYKHIGAFADWHVICGDSKDGLVFLEEDSGIFTAGYVPMEQYYCKIESSMLSLSGGSRL